jgi:hypothetical protein
MRRSIHDVYPQQFNEMPQSAEQQNLPVIKSDACAERLKFLARCESPGLIKMNDVLSHLFKAANILKNKP